MPQKKEILPNNSLVIGVIISLIVSIIIIPTIDDYRKGINNIGIYSNDLIDAKLLPEKEGNKKVIVIKRFGSDNNISYLQEHKDNKITSCLNLLKTQTICLMVDQNTKCGSFVYSDGNKPLPKLKLQTTVEEWTNILLGFFMGGVGLFVYIKATLLLN